MINLSDRFDIRFQADIFDHGDADVIVAEDLTFYGVIDFLNSRGIECFVFGGRLLKNRISVGGGVLRRMGWYESEEYQRLQEAGKIVYHKRDSEEEAID